MSSYALASVMMIASGSIHAVVNAIIKGKRSSATAPAGSRATDIMAARGVTDGTSAIVLLPAIVLVPLPAGAWNWLAISAFVHIVYLYAMIRTYAVADFSAAYPILRGTAPLVTAAVSIGLLGEAVTAAQIAGIALIGAAIFLLLVGRHLDRVAFGWAVLTGAMTALYTVADAHGVRAAPTVGSYIVWDFVAVGGLSVVMFTALSRGRLVGAMRRQWRPCAAAGVLSVVTYGLALSALAMGPTAPLAALRETGMVTALAIAVLALGEHVTWQRAGAVIGIVVGAALVIVR